MYSWQKEPAGPRPGDIRLKSVWWQKWCIQSCSRQRENKKPILHPGKQMNQRKAWTRRRQEWQKGKKRGSFSCWVMMICMLTYTVAVIAQPLAARQTVWDPSGAQESERERRIPFSHFSTNLQSFRIMHDVNVLLFTTLKHSSLCFVDPFAPLTPKGTIACHEPRVDSRMWSEMKRNSLLPSKVTEREREQKAASLFTLLLNSTWAWPLLLLPGKEGRSLLSSFYTYVCW